MDVPPFVEMLTLPIGRLTSSFRSSWTSSALGSARENDADECTGDCVEVASEPCGACDSRTGMASPFISLLSGVLRNTESKRMMGKPSCLNCGYAGVVSSKTIRSFASSKPFFSCRSWISYIRHRDIQRKLSFCTGRYCDKN